MHKGTKKNNTKGKRQKVKSRIYHFVPFAFTT
jgi:hypothetical protein